jgi:hypothetical protein
MVSSTVYHYEYQLEQVAAILRGYRYDIIMSPEGTVPIRFGVHNFDSCLQAVKACDVFFGIIRGAYGSGRAPGERSITHQEIRHAIALDKPRFFAVEQKVEHARQLLRPLLKDRNGNPTWNYAEDVFKGNPIIDDLRVLEMYDEALLSGTPLMQRTNHWCQPYRDDARLLEFVQAQFRDQVRLRAEIAILHSGGII